jgi:hypothetical protein
VTVGVSVLLWLTLPLFLDGDAVARSLQRAADWVEIRVLRALGRKPGQLLRLDTLLSRSKSGLSRAASRSASAAAFDSPESRWSASSSHSAGGASLDSQMGEMRAIQKMLQRRSSRDEAWMRVRGSFKIVIGFYQVCTTPPLAPHAFHTVSGLFAEAVLLCRERCRCVYPPRRPV